MQKNYRNLFLFTIGVHRQD